MTSKEEANKLRYQIESAMQDADMRGHYNQATKELAFIAIDKLLEYSKAHGFVGLTEHYEQVKQEIEKL